MTLDPGEPATKLRGDYRGAQTHPTRTVEPGERIGSATRWWQAPATRLAT